MRIPLAVIVDDATIQAAHFFASLAVIIQESECERMGCKIPINLTSVTGIDLTIMLEPLEDRFQCIITNLFGIVQLLLDV